MLWCVPRSIKPVLYSYRADRKIPKPQPSKISHSSTITTCLRLCLRKFEAIMPFVCPQGFAELLHSLWMNPLLHQPWHLATMTTPWLRVTLATNLLPLSHLHHLPLLLPPSALPLPLPLLHLHQSASTRQLTATPLALISPAPTTPLFPAKSPAVPRAQVLSLCNRQQRHLQSSPTLSESLQLLVSAPPRNLHPSVESVQ